MTTTIDATEADYEELARDGERFRELQAGLAEAGLTPTDWALQLDTMGFERLGADAEFPARLDMQQPRREAVVKRSRVYWRNEPTNSRTVSTWTNYAFGREWQIKAADDAFQELIDRVLRAKVNRTHFSRSGWRRNSNALLVDGERIFALFVGPETVAVRTFDSVEVDEVLTNPEDREEIWYWRRTWTTPDNKRHTRFYRDWNFVTVDGQLRNDSHPWMKQEHLAGLADVDTTPVDGVFVSGLTWNTLGLRGYPHQTASLPWQKAFTDYMRDRQGLSAARASFAYRASVKGGANAVEAVRSVFDTPNPLTNPGARHVPGSAFVSNEGVTIDQFSGASDGSSANYDMRALRQMAIAAGGLGDYYFDPATGNLATAQAMKRPNDAQYRAYQDTWVEWLEDLFDHIAMWFGFKGETTVDIDPPEIEEIDLVGQLNALTQLVAAYPILKTSRELLSMFLTNMGMNNVPELMAEFEDNWDEMAARVLEPPPPPPGQPPTGPTREAIEIIREAAKQ